MLKLAFQTLVSVLLAALFGSCAQIVPLGGGNRDISPPRLLESVPAQKSTEFAGNVIVLKFDEYVKLVSHTEQLIITPRLSDQPEVTADGKKVVINLKPGQLQPNTTYRFYFGNSIADMHESNALKDFDFIFSTGPFIDTLQLCGSVTDAFNNQPVPGVMAGLYLNPNNTDSLVYKIKPDYYTKTNATGQFTLQNLPTANYRLYAISDNNKNFVYDGDAEKVAFLPPDLNLYSDSTAFLKIFQEESPKAYVKKIFSPYNGFGQLVLNKKCRVALSLLSSQTNNKLYETRLNQEKDTISFYYTSSADTLQLVLINFNVSKTDTLKMAVPKIVSKRKVKLPLLNTVQGKLTFNNKPRLTFPVWMDTSAKISTNLKLFIKSDSIFKMQDVKGRWLDIANYEILNKMNEGSDYRIKLDTSSFYDHLGNGCDTGLFNFKSTSAAELGKVTIKLKVNRKQNYLIQLLNAQQTVVEQKSVSFSLSSSNAINVEFKNIQPGDYVVKIVYDNNENQKWDTGNVNTKKLPEPVFLSEKKLKVLPEWDVEEEILLKEIASF